MNKEDQILEAIRKGLEFSKRHNWRTFGTALAVKVAIQDAGFRILFQTVNQNTVAK